MRLNLPLWTFWSTTLLLTLAAALNPPLRTRQLDATFDWSAITPTSDLQYHPCYNNTFKCARLLVPLDWSKSNTTTQDQPHAAIAIVTLPAAVSPNSPSYAGPILINPGGPGGSGTEMALTMAPLIQALVDVPEKRHYDILGFDPRGVALTTPSASCYTSQFDRAADGMRADGMPSVLTSQGLKMKFEMARGVARLCEGLEASGEGGVFRFLTTAAVARDMLEIVDRTEEMLRKGNGTGRACGGAGGREKARLQYLGFSYGSVLGNTFASMFPGRVGRMVVDGIADGEDYTTGTWEKNIDDGEAAVDIFYRTCFDAGSACPLRQDTDTSFSEIRTRITALIRTLQQSPVSFIHNNRVQIVTSYLVSETIRTSLYAPISKYESLSHKLAAALAGNFTLLLSDDSVVRFTHTTDVCSEPPRTSPPQSYNFADEAATGIICSDSQASAGDRNLAWAAATVARITNQSSTIGEGWTKIPLACAGWPFAPPYAFRGPFGSPAPGNGSAEDAPAAPLLILSTRTDHATPLANAFALSGLHGGSVVVVQESVGHCALLSSVSQCVYGIVREYFDTGAVPVNGTVCEAECVPSIPYKACPGLPGM